MLLLIMMSGLWTTTDSSVYISGARQPEVDEQSTAGVPVSEPSDNITAQLGATVDLSCGVTQSADTGVSWVRRQAGQLRLLSVGSELYSSDSRYSVRRLEAGDWQLRVQTLQEADQGSYECQVPSHPPRVHAVFLHVVVPELEITDERDVPIKDKFYNPGSTIQLKCRLKRVPRPSHFLLWRHGGRVLNHDTTRGGISVRTDLTEEGAWSRLLMAHASSLDSGNYSCSLADVADASVTVHVLNGEAPAAMQHGGSPRLLPLQALVAIIPLVHSLVNPR